MSPQPRPPEYLPATAPDGFALPEKLPRIVRNQREVNLSRAMRATDDLIAALRELPLPVQNTMLHLLVARIERGDADAR